METLTNLQSQASPSERSSPFYLKNKAICEDWEKFTKSHSGEIKGKYTAWALILQAKIVAANKEWIFDVEKSTMTNNSFYFILFNKKDVHEITNIKTTHFDSFAASFVIRPKKRSDLLWKKWTKNYSELNSKLIMTRGEEIDPRLDELVSLVKNLDEGSNLIKIKFDKSTGSLSLSNVEKIN